MVIIIKEIWVCKICGRSIAVEEGTRPNFCYYDRINQVERIGNKNNVKKMGLDIPEGETFEFPGDVRWDPFSGKPMVASGKKLKQLQSAVMVGVRG